MAEAGAPFRRPPLYPVFQTSLQRFSFKMNSEVSQCRRAAADLSLLLLFVLNPRNLTFRMGNWKYTSAVCTLYLPTGTR